MTALDTSLLQIVGTQFQRSMKTNRCSSEKSIWTFEIYMKKLQTILNRSSNEYLFVQAMQKR